MNPLTPARLTYCRVDDDLLRIWGITSADRERYEYIEKILDMSKDRLAQGFGRPKSVSELARGNIVLAKVGIQFKRVSIIQPEPGTKCFRVQFLDVGNVGAVIVDDIRLTSAIPHLKALDEAPCAQDYILGDALVKSHVWSAEVTENVNHSLRVHNEVKYVDTVAGKTLISCSVLDSKALVPFCTLLVQRGLGDYASLDAIKAAVLRKHAPMNYPPPRIPQPMLVRHPYPPDMMQPSMISPPMNNLPLRTPPGLGVYPRPPPPRIAPQPAIRAQQFKVDTLPVGTQHEVHVSHVIDGAQSFMIQLKKNLDSNRLQKLMAALNDDRIIHEPVEQCYVGLMCLGRYSEDGSLCRAVVSMVLTDGANLLFVDFGNTETVPFDDIFKLPAHFFEEPIMALQFTLSGLSTAPALLSQEGRQIFEELAQGADSLLLYVTKPEIQLKQYCELYIRDHLGAKMNIKQKVLDKVKLMKPAEYKKLSFKQNSSNDVIVSFVESPTRFFVQLEVNQPLLDTLMASVEDYCLTSAMKDFLYIEDVNDNMAVCCQYTGDNKWYRGLIAEEPMDDGNVVVFYVDYGNQDTVHFSKLRIMNNEMISKLPMQAVECRLDIDADFALREEVVEAFVELADTNSYKMKVINVLPANVLLVDLFDEEDNNVKDVLLNLFSAPEPISPLAGNPPRSASSQGSGNWRERKTSSNDGEYSVFRRDDQQRSRGKSDSDDRSRRGSDYKRQDSRGVDETDDVSRAAGKEHSSSDRWPQDRADKRGSRDEWSPKSNGRDDDRYGGKQRDDGGNRRFDRDGEGRWNSRDGDRKPYRRQDDGDSRGGGSRGGDDDERKPYRKRDDSPGSRSSRDGDSKKSYGRDDRRGGGGYRRNDDDWTRGKSDRNGEKSADDWRGGGKKSDSSWGGKRNESDFGGRSNNSDWNSKKSDDWGSKKSDDYGNQKNDDWGGKKNDDWGGKKNDDWGGKKNDDWGGKKNDDWGGKKNDDWGGKKNDDWGGKKKDDWSPKKNDGDDWGGKKNDSDWKGKPSFDRDSRPRRDNDYKPRDGGFNSRDGNRQRGGGFGAQNDSYKPTPALSDGYPTGSKLVENDFQVGQQMAVEISWFLNPVHFFLIPAGNADFRQLMETMQPDYPKRKSAELNSLSPGDFVVARAKDDVIYRAKIIQTRPGGATVSFVDYGNSESVSRNQIWTIGSDHCSQPVQAMCCGLFNISSTGEGGWSLPNDGEKYFGKEKYTVTFVECREEASSKTWFVNLADENNQDIADLLVADGLAVKNTVLKSEELYDINLLRDQILSVFPGHIESSKKFFVHIEPPKAEQIQQSIATLAETPDSLMPVPTEQICEGEFCLAVAEDEVYYRAQILSVNAEEKVARVVYIDYGDENDVAFDATKILPEYLMIYNPQAVECCLHDAESFTNEEAFHEALNEQDFMIKVMDVIDNKLSVFVYDINGARLPYPTEVEDNVDVLCSLPMLKACEQVFVTHITTDKVYLSRTSDAAYVTELCEQLTKQYDAEELSKVPLEPGVFYAVKSKVFESWYRSILPSADSQEVYYIDYGNTEPVEDLLAVKPLDKSFFVSPIYCVAASTSIKFTCTELTTLIDTVAPVIFTAKFEKQPDGWFVDLKCEKTGKTLADFATECECTFEAVENKTDAGKPYVAFNEWQLNEEKNVSLAHVVSPNSFYLHLASDVPKIEAMQQNLQPAVHRSLPVVGPVDGLFATRKSDGLWCRAAVSDQQTVFAVDFGETLTSTVMKKLPLSFAEDQSNYIVECSLNVNPIDASWSDASMSRFRDLVGSGTEIVAKLEFKKSPQLIDLMVDGVSIGSTLVNENLAQWKCHEVIVSHANSLGDFYIQEPELANDLYELAEKLKEAETWESVEPAVDDLVVAQYDEDEQWYRAVIVKIEDDVKDVRFVDYGNESPCSQFRVLPDSLKSIPYFAAKCSLHTIPENVDDLDEKFIDLVGSADGSFTVYFLNRVEPMLVMLYYNNTAIEDVLQEKAVEVVEVPAEVVEVPTEAAEVPTEAAPTESVVFDNVAVCHINSPSSFYVQSETAPLGSVETALVDIESAAVAEPAINKIVAALFPDDGVWYRAKICDMTDGIHVLFTDYGNSCIVEELRQLPEIAQNIPALAKHCAFTLPTGLDQWPDIANQRFAELTCEGNTIFKLNLLEEGDPAYVDLQDVGVNVADELATLCKADLATTTLPSKVSEMVLLSHVESLNELWIQFQSPQLDEMADEMANAETFEVIDAADEGSLVAALFDDDGAWYRAKVIKVVDGTFDVLFIDYGNRSSTSTIRSLPADLVNLPALAKCCQLKDFEVTECHVDAVVAKLKEMAESGQTFVVRELVEIDGQNYVTLAYEKDKDLTAEMRTFYSALVASDTSVSSKSDAIEEAEEIKTTESIQDVDATENAESVNVGSEGVTDSEKVVETEPDVSETISDSTHQNHVAENESQVTEKTAIEDEPVTNHGDSAAKESVPTKNAEKEVPSQNGDQEPVPSAVEESVPTENAEKESAPSQNGDQEPIPSRKTEEELVSGQVVKEESICNKTEKVAEKIHEVTSAISADDSLEVIETPHETAVAETTIPSESETTADEDLYPSDDVESVEEPVVAEAGLNDSLVSENSVTEVRVTTPLSSGDDEKMLDTSGATSDLTPDFKTPLSKFAFDADDSFAADATPTDEESNPDHFESAVGPVDSASPSAAPNYSVDDAEFMDYLRSNLHVSNKGAVECIIVGRTLKEFVEERHKDQSSAEVSDVGQGVEEFTTACVPPSGETEEFDSLKSFDSVPAAGEDEEPLDENAGLVDEEFMDSSMEIEDVMIEDMTLEDFMFKGMTLETQEFVEKLLKVTSHTLASDVDSRVEEFAIACMPPSEETEKSDSLESTDSTPAAGEDAKPLDENVGRVHKRFMDSSIEVKEFLLEGMTPQEFIEKNCNDQSSASVSNVGSVENKSTPVSKPPLVQTKEFNNLETTASAPTAGEDAKHLDAPVVSSSESQPLATVSEASQFEDADDLADLLRGMTLSEKPRVTSAPPKVKSQDQEPPPKVEPVVHDLIDLSTHGNPTTQSKGHPKLEGSTLQVSSDPILDSETELSSIAKTVARPLIGESGMVADQSSQPMETTKSSESDESTAVLAQSQEDSDKPAELSTVDSTAPEVKSEEVVEKSAKSAAEMCKPSTIADGDQVVPNSQGTVESDSKVADVAPAKQSDSPSSGKLLSEIPVASPPANESIAADVKYKTIPESEETLSETASELSFSRTALEEGSVSSSTNVVDKLFTQLVARANDKEKLHPSKPAVSGASDEFVGDDKKTSKCADTFAELVSEVSNIEAAFAQDCFAQLVAAANDEFNSTSNSFCIAEDTLGLVSSSDSESDDLYTDSTSADISLPDIVAQFITSEKGDSRAHIQLPSTAKCDTLASEVAAPPSALVKSDSCASDAVPPLISVKGETAPSPPVQDESPAVEDVDKATTPVAEVSTLPSPITRDEDAQSPATGADSSLSRRDAGSDDALAPDVPEKLEENLSVHSFKYVPPRRKPLRPEVTLAADPPAQLAENISTRPTSITVAAETAPALPVESAVDARSESTELPEDDGESLPSSGAAEVAHTLANVWQRENSDDEALRHRQSPPKIAMNGASATSQSLATASDASKSATPAHEQSDSGSVYFDSCAESRCMELSDDEQPPKSYTSSSSDETSIASGGDADEADLVVVSYVNTPGHFYVQKVASQEKLRSIEKQLDELKNAEIALSEVRQGCTDQSALYGAQIDDRLYRVCVVEESCAGESGAEYSVCCIDYGQVCRVRKLFSLPESLRGADPCATPCSLKLPYYLQTWPVDVCHEFERLVMTKRPKFQLKCREMRGVVAIVDLIRRGRSINQRMKTLCEEFDENKECDVKANYPPRTNE